MVGTRVIWGLGAYPMNPPYAAPRYRRRCTHMLNMVTIGVLRVENLTLEERWKSYRAHMGMGAYVG
jgi:hypothetical protein